MLLFVSLAFGGEQGTILAIEGPRFYTDLSADDGLRPDDKVLVYRLIEVDHGGAALSDPFYLGEARVVEVGGELSLLQGDPSLVLSVGVGDLVSLEPIQRPAPAERAPKEAAPPRGGDAPGQVVVERVEVVPEDVREYAAIMAEPQGRSEALAGWLERWPESTLAPSVEAMLQGPVVEEPSAAPLTLIASSAGQVDEGEGLKVSVTVPDKARVASAQLFFRREGEGAFRQRPMDASGDVFWQAELPSESAVYPSVEWYVAVQDTEGHVHESDPRRVDVVRELPGEGPRKGANDMAVRYEYVEFWWAEPGLDRLHHGEVEYTYRMRYKGLQAFRVGYGAYSGDGGVVAELEAASTPAELEAASQPVGFQYGYTELELHPVPQFGAMLRTTVGIDRGGLNGGLHGRVRFGHEEGTNLQLGAGRSWSVGDEYVVALAWNSVPRVPMLASVYVTNQPGFSSEDFGVRLVYEPRVQITPWLEMGLRVGYQLRNTNHLGPSFGGATVFTW